MKKIVIFIIFAILISLLTVFIYSGGKTLKVKVDSGIISGELIHCSKDVIVIIVAGSGPTDMNGNSPLVIGENDSLLQLAKGLESKGISTFRYDKRSAGKSVETFDNTEQIYFDAFVDDLNACITKLKDMGYKKIILAGHSQGALVGMLVAENADGYISIAGSGYPINETILKQYGSNAEMFSKEIETIKMLSNGNLNEKIAKEDTIFSINNQIFLLSWMKYDPRLEIAKLSLPVLLIQGDADLQVSIDNVQELQNAYPDAYACTVEDMNHVLKKVLNDDENIKSYQDPSYVIHEELVSLVVDFINMVMEKE